MPLQTLHDTFLVRYLIQHSSCLVKYYLPHALQPPLMSRTYLSLLYNRLQLILNVVIIIGCTVFTSLTLTASPPHLLSPWRQPGTRSHCGGDDHCHDLELGLEEKRTQLTSTCDGGDCTQTPVLRHSYGFSIMLHSLQLYHWLCRFYSSRYLDIFRRKLDTNIFQRLDSRIWWGNEDEIDKDSKNDFTDV